MKIGFSTGSIALGDVERGLNVASRGGTRAIELSALRESELDSVLGMLDRLQVRLEQFDHVSFHAPSRRERLSEKELVEKLLPIADRNWAIIVHPDMIEDCSLWRKLGSSVCIENMDKRKAVGSTADQLARFFDELPDATFCFDIGHARQVDPTMQEAEDLIRRYGDKMRQVHMSFVNSKCRHERLNDESILAFQRVARLIPTSVPLILETPVREDEVESEIAAAERVFGHVFQH